MGQKDVQVLGRALLYPGCWFSSMVAHYLRFCTTGLTWFFCGTIFNSAWVLENKVDHISGFIFMIIAYTRKHAFQTFPYVFFMTVCTQGVEEHKSVTNAGNTSVYVIFFACQQSTLTYGIYQANSEIKLVGQIHTNLWESCILVAAINTFLHQNRFPLELVLNFTSIQPTSCSHINRNSTQALHPIKYTRFGILSTNLTIALTKYSAFGQYKWS